jgi:hypothetical protein
MFWSSQVSQVPVCTAFIVRWAERYAPYAPRCHGAKITASLLRPKKHGKPDQTGQRQSCNLQLNKVKTKRCHETSTYGNPAEVVKKCIFCHYFNIHFHMCDLFWGCHRVNGGNSISRQNSFASDCGLISSLMDRRRPEAHLYGQITCYNDFC